MNYIVPIELELYDPAIRVLYHCGDKDIRLQDARYAADVAKNTFYRKYLSLKQHFQLTTLTSVIYKLFNKKLNKTYKSTYRLTYNEKAFLYMISKKDYKLTEIKSEFGFRLVEKIEDRLKAILLCRTLPGLAFRAAKFDLINDFEPIEVE